MPLARTGYLLSMRALEPAVIEHETMNESKLRHRSYIFTTSDETSASLSPSPEAEIHPISLTLRTRATR